MTIKGSVAEVALFPEELIAAILLSTSGSVSDLSRKLIELKNHGINIGYIAIRRVPEGFYSEDIDQHISYLLTYVRSIQLINIIIPASYVDIPICNCW